MTSPHAFTGTDFEIERDFAHFYAPLIDMMMEELKPCAGGRILEIGAGSGPVARALSAKGLKVCGTDISAERIHEAKKLSDNSDGAGPTWAVANSESLCFGDSSFDAAVSRSVFQYTRRRDVIDELHRVLRAGGKAVLMENLKYNPFSWLFRITRFLGIKERVEKSNIVSHLTPSEVESFGEIFAVVHHREFYLFSVLSLFWLLGVRSRFLFRACFDILFRVDEWILGLFPALRKFCWITFVVLSKE